MKKILAFVLTLAMMLTLLNVGLVVSADHLTEAPDGYTAITDEAGFLAMEANGKYILMADITLDADRVGGAGTETTYTIPAGVTLDGNGYAILSGRYNPDGTATLENWSTSEDTTKCIAWDTSLLALGEGAKITLSNVNFGTEANPIFLGKNAVSWNLAHIFANDTANTVVEWNNVSFYVCRYGWGLSGANTSAIMLTMAGTHTFNNCVRNGFTSAASQTAGWIQNANGTVTLNNCVNNGKILGTNVGGFILSASGTITMNNCVNNVEISGTYENNASNSSGFIASLTGSASFTGCVNNGAVKNAAKTGGFIGNLATTKAVSLTNCVNNADISTNRGAAVGETAQYNVYAGGFIGQGYIGSGAWNITLTGCKNYGAISQTASGAKSGSTAGGLIGQISSPAAVTGSISFEDCINKGTISSMYNHGGMIGTTVNAHDTQYSFTRCINTGDMTTKYAAGGMAGVLTVNASMDGCVNTGTIDASNGGERVGGMVGKLTGTARTLNITNSVNLGTIKGSGKNTNATYGYYQGSAGQFVGGVDGGATIDALNKWKNDEGVGGIYLSNVYAGGDVVLHENAKTPDGSAALTEPYNYGVAGWGCDNFYVDTYSNIVVLTADQSEIIGDSKYILTYAAADIVTPANQNSNLPVDFMVDNGEIIIASPTLAGYQISTDGKSVRFLATIDSLVYTEVGFTYTVETEEDLLIDNKTKTTTIVYEAVNANVNGIVSEKTAASLGASYIYALTFINVPTEGYVAFTIQAIADGFASATYVVEFEDGAFVGYTIV